MRTTLVAIALASVTAAGGVTAAVVTAAPASHPRMSYGMSFNGKTGMFHGAALAMSFNGEGWTRAKLVMSFNAKPGAITAIPKIKPRMSFN